MYPRRTLPPLRVITRGLCSWLSIDMSYSFTIEPLTRIHAQQKAAVGLHYIEIAAVGDHRVEHPARFLVGGRGVGVLDEVRRVRAVPCAEVGNVGGRPIAVDAQDRRQLQVVRQGMRAATHFDQHVERACRRMPRRSGRKLAPKLSVVLGSASATTCFVPLASTLRHATAVAGRVGAVDVDVRRAIDRVRGHQAHRPMPASATYSAPSGPNTRPRGLVKPVA